jgi:hypothetical protein
MFNPLIFLQFQDQTSIGTRTTILRQYLEDSNLHEKEVQMLSIYTVEYLMELTDAIDQNKAIKDLKVKIYKTREYHSESDRTST